MRSSLVLFFMLMAVSAVTCQIIDPNANKQCQSKGYLGYCNSGSGFRLDEICKNLKCATQRNKSGYRFSSESIGPATAGTKCGFDYVCNEEHECVPAQVEDVTPKYFYSHFGSTDICKGLRLATEPMNRVYESSIKATEPVAVGTKCGPDHVCNKKHKCIPTPLKDRLPRYICNP